LYTFLFDIHYPSLYHAWRFTYLQCHRYKDATTSPPAVSRPTSHLQYHIHNPQRGCKSTKLQELNKSCPQKKGTCKTARPSHASPCVLCTKIKKKKKVATPRCAGNGEKRRETKRRRDAKRVFVLLGEQLRRVMASSLGDRLERRKCLSVAARDLETGLDVAVDVHETPFVFPVLAWLVVADLPWLVERREPDKSLACCVWRSLQRYLTRSTLFGSSNSGTPNLP
jgi:hypothetical protein